MSYTGRCDGYHAKGYKSEDSPGRWNGSSVADGKETNNCGHSERSE